MSKLLGAEGKHELVLEKNMFSMADR